jgi:hypothetical protein
LKQRSVKNLRRLGFEKITSVDGFGYETIFYFFNCRRNRRGRYGSLAFCRSGNNIVDKLLCHAAPAGVMDGDKVDIILDKLKPFPDGIETLGTADEDRDTEEFQIRPPLNVNQFLVIFGNA